MLKKLVKPIQSWLIKNHKCVGCGRLLDQQKSQKLKNGSEKVTCQCGRIFIKENGKYRRALFSEV